MSVKLYGLQEKIVELLLKGESPFLLGKTATRVYGERLVVSNLFQPEEKMSTYFSSCKEHAIERHQPQRGVTLKEMDGCEEGLDIVSLNFSATVRGGMSHGFRIYRYESVEKMAKAISDYLTCHEDPKDFVNKLEK